jgi:hypothetical protein
MDKSGYDFRIQCAEIDEEDVKFFKQWNHLGLCYECRFSKDGKGTVLCTCMEGLMEVTSNIKVVGFSAKIWTRYDLN